MTAAAAGAAGNTMRAVYYEKFRATPTIETLPDPVPAPGGVVIKVEATGLCRSDHHGWMGHDPDIRLPHVPGHELAGTIAAVGKGVTRFREGERVTLPFVGGCGHCHECHSGNQQVCPDQFQPGFTAWGSFAQFVAIEYADTNLVRLPDSIDYVTAASLGCRFATAFRALVDQARVQPGEWVAIHGCGGVGLSAVMIANAAGANVIAIDLNVERLALARALGAVATVDASGGADVVAQVIEISGGGAHVSIDALGHPVTCFNSIANLRRRGRHSQIGLMLGENARAAIPMNKVIAHELQVFGTHGMQAWRYDAMLEIILSGRISPRRLVGEEIALEDAPLALAQMDQATGAGISVITRF
jgi:alcohol dehydrogenase